jgi:hypothetical protein
MPVFTSCTLALVGGGVLLFDDAGDLAGAIAQDAAIAGGVVHGHGEEGQGGVAGGGHQALQGGHADQGYVAVEDQGGVAVFHQGHGLLHCVAGALGRVLAGPGQVGGIKGFAHHFATVAIHHHDAPRFKGAGGIQHVGQHGLGSKGLQNFGQHRTHALALASGQYDHFHDSPRCETLCGADSNSGVLLSVACGARRAVVFCTATGIFSQVVVNSLYSQPVLSRCW